MNQENVCRYNQFGYCKFGNTCFRKHENRLCENDHCEVQTCLHRHPRRCRFFFEYDYCKFGTYCRFKHEASGNQDTLKEIKDLREALEKVNQKLIEKEEEIKRKDDEIKAIEVLQDRVKNIDKENLELKDKVRELQEHLENARHSLAVNDMLQMDFKERVQEKYGYDSNDSESDYESDEEKRINNRIKFRMKKVEELRKMVKCDICDYTTKSEVGLKSHKTKKHKGT